MALFVNGISSILIIFLFGAKGVNGRSGKSIIGGLIRSRLGVMFIIDLGENIRFVKLFDTKLSFDLSILRQLNAEIRLTSHFVTFVLKNLAFGIPAEKEVRFINFNYLYLNISRHNLNIL